MAADKKHFDPKKLPFKALSEVFATSQGAPLCIAPRG